MRTSSQRRIDLNDICSKICSEQNSLFKYARCLRNNPDWITDNCTDLLQEDILLRLIDLSCEDKRYTVLLNAVVDVLDGKSVTDKAFYKLVSFPNNSVAESLKISLAHKTLSESQLLVLCSDESIFECFFELAILYYKSPNCDFEKFRNFLDTFSSGKFSYLYEELLLELSGVKTLDEKKLDWIVQQIQGNT